MIIYNFKRTIAPIIIIIFSIIIFVFSEEIKRFFIVKNLFKEENIVYNFSNIHKMFDTVNLGKSTTPLKFPINYQDLVETFKINEEEINTKNFLAETKTTSLMVIKNNKITFEEYYLKTKRSDSRILWSTTKSIVSLVVGVALIDGDIEKIDGKIAEGLPLLENSGFKDVTILQALNMTSGIKFDESYDDFFSDINEFGRLIALGGSINKFTGSMESEEPPGKTQKYSSINTHALAMMLEKKTGYNFLDYFYKKIWSLIRAEFDGKAVIDEQGSFMALGGLVLSTIDTAKFGLIMLNGGYLNNKQIIPTFWINEIMNHKIDPEIKIDESIEPFKYKMHWWFPANSKDEVFASGIYGQYIYINKKDKTVIVKTSVDKRPRKYSKFSKLAHIDLFRAISKSTK